MKNVIRLSFKMFKRNKALNFYIIIQMAVVFAMTIFMLSSIVSRYQYYTPFKDLIEQDGYFCVFSSDTIVIGDFVDEPTDISNAMHNVSESDVCGSYYVDIFEKTDDAIIPSIVCGYDKEIYSRYTPKLESGQWLSDISADATDAIPVVVYDEERDVNTGEIITKHTMYYYLDEEGNECSDFREVRLKVVGVLSNDSEIVYYNGEQNQDCRDIFASVDKILEERAETSIYLCRSQDARANDIFMMIDGVGFINTNDENLTEEQYEKNRSIILGVTSNYVRLSDFKEFSLEFISAQVDKLLPIFVCILILTAVITASVNAITAYREISNFALYYICGMKWSSAMKISLLHAMLQTLIALALAIIGCVICNVFGIISNVILVFHPFHILVCLVMIIINLLLAFCLPYIIVKGNTPREILKEH